MASVEKTKSNSISDGGECVVCFKSVEIFSIGICDHPVCYECSTRMRILCKQNECPICRQEMIKVAFVLEVKPYQQLKFNTYTMEKASKICFENYKIQEKFNDLLVHECRACSTRPTFTSLQTLKDHLRKEHELFFCDLCIDNLKIFTWERRYYTRSELALHRRKGDPDNTSHRGHPLCNFCDQRYYENDELFRHLRRDHYFCHFCDADGLNHYYCNYDDLREHFRDSHFLCEEGECREEKFTRVFRTDIDFRAHRAQVHSQSMGKAAAKQARTLELEFTLAPRSAEGRGRGQGRAPQRERDREREREKEEPQSNMEEASGRSNVPTLVKTTDIRDPEQFPSLTTEQASTTKTRHNVADSLAQKLAKGNRFTVRNTNGMQNDEEFPSLSGEPCLTDGSSSKPKGAANVPRVAKRSVHLKVSNQDSNGNSSKTNTSNVSIQLLQSYPPPTQGAGPPLARVTRVSSSQNILVQPSRGMQLDTDFPSLVPSQGLPSAPPDPKSSWVKKEAPKLNKTNNVKATVTAAPALVKNRQPSAADFPVLAPSSSKSLFEAFGKTCTKDKATVKEKASVVNANGNKAVSLTIPVTDSWSEPRKEGRSKKKKNASRSQGGDDGDSITFQSAAERKIAEMQIGELKSLSNHMGGNTFDLSAAANGAESRGSIGSKLNIIKQESKAAEVNGVKPKTKAQAPAKAPISLSHNDFPALGGKSSGVNLSLFSHSKGPPAVVRKKGPPPDVAVEDVAPTRVTFTSSSGRHFPILVDAAPFYAFLQPPDFAVRNQELITTIMDLLCDQQNRFSQFRTLSARFRNGTVEPVEYYRECLDIMGIDCFQAVFPELLVLLPDIEKQQELLKVHRLEMRTGNGNNNEPYVICATCNQVLDPCDLKHHLASHTLETHFPALSSLGSDSSASAWTKRQS